MSPERYQSMMRAFNMKRPDLALKMQILDAMRATQIPEATAGLWTVRKASLGKPFEIDDHKKRKVILQPGLYTNLWRFTMTPQEQELVMTDFPHELKTHLDFAMKARGRVLISGLGLGCVARGCLANPAVESVVVIERDLDVLKLVEDHMPTGTRRGKTLDIIYDDAHAFAKRCVGDFDCAWHDLWSDPDKQERHIQVNHAHLMTALFPKVRLFQGAWAMARSQRRMFRRALEGKML